MPATSTPDTEVARLHRTPADRAAALAAVAAAPELVADRVADLRAIIRCWPGHLTQDKTTGTVVRAETAMPARKNSH
jgi:hypothetical protein